LFVNCKPDNLKVGIPIYASESEIHDYITQSKGSLKQATAGIKNLINLGCKVELRIVVSKLNYLYLNDLATYIISNFEGLVSINFMGLEMLGNAAKNSKIVWIDYKTAFDYSKNAIKKLISNGFDVNLYNFPLCFVDEGFWSICRQSISDYKVNYNDECSGCSVKEICGGIFDSTSRFCGIDVKPIG
jgi:His-Xaa-Ser system radical SAM maturase HxsC